MNVNRSYEDFFHFLRINKIKQNEGKIAFLFYLGHPVLKTESTWPCCCIYFYASFVGELFNSLIIFKCQQLSMEFSLVSLFFPLFQPVHQSLLLAFYVLSVIFESTGCQVC